MIVVGSHGLETRGGPSVELDDDERTRLATLRQLAREAEVIAGTGSWIEQKPASVVLHVRQAAEERGRLATRWLVDAACKIEGGHVKTGHAVVELLTRSTSKAHAVERLRRHYGRAVVAFAGDDLTDEEVFAGLGPRRLRGTRRPRHDRRAIPPGRSTAGARVAVGVAHRLRRGHRRPRPLLRTLTGPATPPHRFCLLHTAVAAF